MYTYDGCCGSCVHMNTNDYVNHKDHCYCTYRRQYYNLKDKKCSYYEYDRNKDYYDLNNRWHIVSAVLGILQKTAADEDIEKLACFRIDILEHDSRYNDILCAYDIIGPFLARQISLDTDRYEICQMLLKYWFYPINDMLENSKTDAALEKYIVMVNNLTRHYAQPLKVYCDLKRISFDAMRMIAEYTRNIKEEKNENH